MLNCAFAQGILKEKNMSSLLILGAGQFGYMVKEIAQSVGRFEKFIFLDDRNSIAVGRLDELCRFAGEYEYAIVAIGNSLVRESYLKRLAKDFKIATLISPFAFVSPSAVCGEGTIIEPMAVIQTGSLIGKGCIISSGAVARHNSTVGDYCHLDCNSVVLSGATVPPCVKVRVGELFDGSNS